MPKTEPSLPDRRALKILADTYWANAVWIPEKKRATPPEDFLYAKRAGIMFDPIRLSHEDIVERAITAIQAIDANKTSVANAFVCSLTSKRMDLRSALGSYAVVRHLTRHAGPTGRNACAVCGAHDLPNDAEDMNVLNFERFKWGGVRHHGPIYAAFDLEQFALQPPMLPTPSDVAVLQGVLAAIEAAPADTSSASLEKYLSKSFKSNKAERDVVVGILGFCGILETAEHSGYLQHFIPWSKRELPARRFVDMPYPACWWTRSDGINRAAVTHWFGHLL